MHSNVFTEISILIALGAGVALIMRLFRQPLIIGHIITGVIAGPALFNIIHSESSFAGLSSMGVALLLFIIGLDLSLKVFSRLGKTVAITAFIQIGLVTLAGYLTSISLGFTKTESFIIGLGVSLSSTIIIVKLLNDKKETSRLYAQITIGVLLVQDVIATLGKIAMATKAGINDPTQILQELFIHGAILVAILFVFSRYVIPRLNKVMESNKELLLLFALGWGLGFATLFEHYGFSIEIGALFAGVSLASLPYSAEMASRLRPIRDFFLVIFFITLGQTMDPSKMTAVIWPALALLAIAVLFKPIAMMLGMGTLGYTKGTSFKAAVTMSQVSEFSLIMIVSAQHSGLASERAVTTLSLVAFVSFAISAYLIKYDKPLYELFESKLSLFERKVTKFEQKDAYRYPFVLFGYRRGGQEYVRLFKQMKHRFAVVDYDPEIIESLERAKVNYLYGDVTDVELLEEIGIENTKLAVSTLSDFETNLFLLKQYERVGNNCVFICHADSFDNALELYEHGADYVMLPHYIGTEKISNFLLKSGLKKSEFKKFKSKHLEFLASQKDDGGEEQRKRIGKAMLERMIEIANKPINSRR